MRWRAECKNGNSAFYTFWVIFLGTLSLTKTVFPLLLEKRLSYIHQTLYKYQPTWVDVQCARIVTLLISLGTLPITKTIIYDYFIPGYDCAIDNYIDRYLY